MSTYKYEAVKDTNERWYITISELNGGVNEPWGYIKLGLVLSEDWLNLVLELINTRSRLKPSQVLEYIRKISPSAGIKRGYIEGLWNQI
jgi:hypothetical protein